MKRFITLLCCCIFTNGLVSAQISTKYIVGDFNEIGNYKNPYKTNGVHRFGFTQSDMLFITNIAKNYTITFNHFEHRKLELLDLPIAELENLNEIIYAEALLKFETADDAYKWMLNTLKNEVKIYVINTNKFYKSNDAINAPDRMKVIEVAIDYEDIPDHILNTL